MFSAALLDESPFALLINELAVGLEQSVTFLYMSEQRFLPGECQPHSPELSTGWLRSSGCTLTPSPTKGRVGCLPKARASASISPSSPQTWNCLAPVLLQDLVIRLNRGNEENNLYISDGFINRPPMCTHQMEIRIWLEAVPLRCAAQR